MTPSADPAAALFPPVAVPARLIQPGELVVLAIKPSLCFIPLVSLPIFTLAAAVLVLAYLLERLAPSLLPLRTVLALCLTGCLARLLVAVLQWVARLYVLTDRRVMRVKGVLDIDIFECPLSRIQNTFLSLTLSERVCAVGTLFFATAGTAGVEAAWLMIARPREVHEIVIRHIQRAQHGSSAGPPPPT